MRPKKPKKHTKPTKVAKPEPVQPDVMAVYPGIDHCAGATGIPVALIRKAKKAGCTAFDSGSRVKLLPLLRWIFSQPAATGDDFIDLEHQQARLAKEKADALSEKRQREEKESNFLEEVEAMLNEQLILPCRSWLTSAPSSLAARCNPNAPEVARRILEDAFNKEFFPLMRSKLTKPAKKQS